MRKILIPPVFLIACLAAMIVVSLAFADYNLIVFPYNLIGLGFVYVGLSIMSKVRMLFKKHETTIKYEQSSKLVTEGIFAKSRNPMYLGMFMMLAGIAFLLTNIIGFVFPFLFVAALNFICIPYEEKMLQETFSEEFVEYSKNVNRWF